MEREGGGDRLRLTMLGGSCSRCRRLGRVVDLQVLAELFGSCCGSHAHFRELKVCRNP